MGSYPSDLSFTLNEFAQIVLIMIVGPLVGVILLANILELAEVMPSLFKFFPGKVLGGFS